jgi:hypothetical protein
LPAELGIINDNSFLVTLIPATPGFPEAKFVMTLPANKLAIRRAKLNKIIDLAVR